MRENYLSGVKWEKIVGYSRAVKIDNVIYISGTTATDESGEIVGKDNPYLQTIQCLKNIEKALNSLNANLSDVVRTRMFVTDITQWDEYGRAHGEVFHSIQPASVMVEISRLINPDMMVEIEAEAVIIE